MKYLLYLNKFLYLIINVFNISIIFDYIGHLDYLNNLDHIGHLDDLNNPDNLDHLDYIKGYDKIRVGRKGSTILENYFLRQIMCLI